MKYRLTAVHSIQDALLPAGTEIGDGTPYPFRELGLDGKTWVPRLPSMFMEPLDQEAHDAIVKRNRQLAQKGARPELPVPPLVMEKDGRAAGQGPVAPSGTITSGGPFRPDVPPPGAVTGPRPPEQDEKAPDEGKPTIKKTLPNI